MVVRGLPDDFVYSLAGIEDAQLRMNAGAIAFGDVECVWVWRTIFGIIPSEPSWL